MKYYTDKTYTKEKDGRTYTINWHVEEWADLSDLGEFTSKADDYIVDRQDGTLRGTWPEEPDEPDRPYPEDFPDTPEGEVAYDAAIEKYDIEWAEYDRKYTEWDENGPTILAQYLPRMNRNEYRYFKPLCGGMNPEDDLKEWTKYAVQDYRRASSYGNDWCYLYLTVKTYAPACRCCGHQELLIESIGMIESDIEDSEADSLIDDLIFELEAEIKKLQKSPQEEVETLMSLARDADEIAKTGWFETEDK